MLSRHYCLAWYLVFNYFFIDSLLDPIRLASVNIVEVSVIALVIGMAESAFVLFYLDDLEQLDYVLVHRMAGPGSWFWGDAFGSP